MKTLLLAEDDPHIAVLVGYALEAVGLSIETLADGRRVQDRLLRAPRPDLVVLDVNLPGLSGFDILKWMKESGDLSDVPVLMLSAASLLSYREQARRLGALDFIEKPFDIGRLARLVQNAMGKSGA